MMSSLAVVELQSKDMPCLGDAPSIHHFFKQAIQDYKDIVHAIFAFAVAGERKLIAVLQCEKWHSLDSFNASIQKTSTDIFFTVHPVLEYEKFALYLGVDSSLLTPPSRKFSSDRHIYLMEFNIDFKGKTSDEMRLLWLEDATAMLTERKSGLELEAFKVVGEQRVYAFFSANADKIDSLTFTLPMMRQLGSGVTTKCKPVVFV